MLSAVVTLRCYRKIYIAFLYNARYFLFFSVCKVLLTVSSFISALLPDYQCSLVRVDWHQTAKHDMTVSSFISALLPDYQCSLVKS